MPPTADSASSAPQALQVWAENTSDPTSLVVHAGGEIDLASVADLRRHLQELVTSARRTVVIDLSGTTFLAGCGLSLLAETAEKAAAEGVGLWLIAGDSVPVRRALDICRFDAVIPRAASVADALGRPARPSGSEWPAPT